VNSDDTPVAGEVDIDFHGIGAPRPGHTHSRQCVLGRHERRAAVSDDLDRPSCRHANEMRIARTTQKDRDGSQNNKEHNTRKPP
jgi:hypothetical protein